MAVLLVASEPSGFVPLGMDAETLPHFLETFSGEGAIPDPIETLTPNSTPSARTFFLP